MRTTSANNVIYALSTLALGLMLGHATPASAQYALGDGRALDNNLRQGSGGQNQRRVQNTYGVYADAIATGNVAGLGGFSEDLGYGAPSEFRGDLGSNTNFSFYQQSLPSALGYVERGGTSYTNPQIAGPNTNAITGESYNTGVVLEAGAGATVGQVTGQTPYAVNPDFQQQQANSYAAYQASIRSSLVLDNKSPYLSSSLAKAQTPDGRLLEIAISPLQGLRTTEIEPDPMDALDINEDANTADQAATPNAALNPEPMGESLSGAVATEPLDLTDTRLYNPRMQLGERLGAAIVANTQTPAELPTTEAPDTTLTDTMGQVNQSIDRVLGASTAEPGEDVYLDLLREIRGETDTETEDPTDPATETETEDEVDTAIDPLTYSAAPLQTLTGTLDTIFNSTMKRAEQYLADERYFDAEDAYRSALRIKSGYPLASVGMAHAQLGAGLYSSSARTLRAHFSMHPELIGVRYGEQLLPSDQRQELIAVQLAEYQKDNPTSTAAPMLTAYLAYQIGDQQATIAALDEMKRRHPSDTLVPLLISVWVGGAGAP